jgi:hypothetical protein
MAIPPGWQQYMNELRREIDKAPEPTRRSRRRIKRMSSKRMSDVEQGQTPDTYKAMFQFDRTPTPIAPDESILTRNIPLPNWSTGKATQTRS